MDNKDKFVFGAQNYQLIIIGFAVTLIGFFLMIGGGSEDPTQFDGDRLFSKVRITISPILVIGGYGVVLYGIMKKRKAK
jgi:hypothetical protein